jgi:hypothetical protein
MVGLTDMAPGGAAVAEWKFWDSCTVSRCAEVRGV